ncbi:hypothetical protein P12x_002977 [Tundrisphaera lichenicola]|uniref:hypothetical protein n=1 Tax=Tundrisphaera lichenicola TaxID=2029860 RepID=UPI003EB9B244
MWCLFAGLAALGVWASCDETARTAQPTLVDGVWVPRVTQRIRNRVVTLSPWNATGGSATLSICLSFMIVMPLGIRRKAWGESRTVLWRPLTGGLIGGLVGLAIWASQSAGPMPVTMSPYAVLIIAQMGALAGWLYAILNDPMLPQETSADLGSSGEKTGGGYGNSDADR